MTNYSLSPLGYPSLPSPEELEATGNAPQAFDAWEASAKAVREENELRFDKALKLMNRCAGIHGFLGIPTSHHFSWCPQPSWESYWEAQGWPELPRIMQL